MEASENNFNYEDYQKKHEGIISKWSKWLGKYIGKHLKVFCSIGALTFIVTFFGVYKQFITTDAGIIIERIYNESKEDVEETNQIIKYVQLPDSLENTAEVQKLRLFQDRVFAFCVIYNSLFKDPHIENPRSKTEEEHNMLLSMVANWIEKMQYLTNLAIDINNEGIDIYIDIDNKKDSIALNSFNLFTMRDIIDTQKEVVNFQNEVIAKLGESQRKRDFVRTIELMRDYMVDKRLDNNIKAFHLNNLMLLNTVNLRLISIKNNAINNKYGRVKKVNNKPFFIPSFMNQSVGNHESVVPLSINGQDN